MVIAGPLQTARIINFAAFGNFCASVLRKIIGRAGFVRSERGLLGEQAFFEFVEEHSVIYFIFMFVLILLLVWCLYFIIDFCLTVISEFIMSDLIILNFNGFFVF